MRRTVLVLILAAAGLPPSHELRRQPGARASFSRAVAPFPVADEAGKPFDLPFLGGLDVPRPQFADIDADGDNDLFLQEFRNEIWFFENTDPRKLPVRVADGSVSGPRRG